MSTTHFATQALHSGHDVKQTLGTRAVPIYQNTSYVFEDVSDAADKFNLTKPGYIYTRLNNPTNDILEQRLAQLEQGIAAVVTASGASAISTTLLTLLRAGDHIVASNSLYGGTYNLLSVTLPRFGITTTFVDPSSPADLEAAITPNTKILFAESLGNPKLDVLDIEAVSKIAKKHQIPLIIDNTVATPYLLQPIKFGADIVIHSLTKYLSGNGTSLGGAIIDAGTFDWSQGKFPEITTPNPGYHGLILHDAFGAASFIAKIRIEGLRDLGAALSPYNAFQILQGIETLALRVTQHSKNALQLAKWLQDQPEVHWVNYPGFSSNTQAALVQKYLPDGQSGVVTFGLHEGYEGAKVVANHCKLFALVANIGDTKSLLIHPASTTHQQLSPESQKTTGVSADLIRLSVGIEDIEDLKADLKQAFQHLKSIRE